MLSLEQKRDLATGVIQLGGIPLYIIVLVRSWIGNLPSYFYQVLFAAAVIWLGAYYFKDANVYIARGMVLAVFTSGFYNDPAFTGMAAIILVLLYYAAQHLKHKTSMMNGTILGVIAIIIGYYLTLLTI